MRADSRPAVTRHAELRDRSAGSKAGSSTSGVESFFYWSKERLVRKAVISVTYVVMTRGHKPGEPDAIVASKNIYATHYVEGSSR
jgi:hypothetical protein